MLTRFLAYCLTLKMMTIYHSEKSVDFHRTVRRFILLWVTAARPSSPTWSALAPRCPLQCQVMSIISNGCSAYQTLAYAIRISLWQFLSDALRGSGRISRSDLQLSYLCELCSTLARYLPAYTNRTVKIMIIRRRRLWRYDKDDESESNSHSAVRSSGC